MDGRRLGSSLFGRGAIAPVVDVALLPAAGHHPLVAALHANGTLRVIMQGPTSRFCRSCRAFPGVVSLRRLSNSWVQEDSDHGDEVRRQQRFHSDSNLAIRVEKL